MDLCTGSVTGIAALLPVLREARGPNASALFGRGAANADHELSGAQSSLVA